MNEHLVRMFHFTRDELLRMFEKKIEGIRATKALCQQIIDRSESGETKKLLGQQEEALKGAIAEFDENIAKSLFLRDHLGEGPSWEVAAEQAVEIFRSLEVPLTMNLAQLELAIDPGKLVQRESHNFTGRRLRM